MDHPSFEQSAHDILTRLDPDKARKRLAARPFFVEYLGPSNSGKTTLMDAHYVAFKAAGYEVAKVVEGAEAVPPPRELPYYNLRTGIYALEKLLSFKYDRNVHLVLFDRAIFDAVVRMEMFAADGTMRPEDAAVVQAFFALPQFRNLFDLHVFLMCAPDVALTRKFGSDHAERVARGELKYSSTTNPKTMQEAYEAHLRVWQASHGDQDPKMFWLDASFRTPKDVAHDVARHVLEAFRLRMERTP